MGRETAKATLLLNGRLRPDLEQECLVKSEAVVEHKTLFLEKHPPESEAGEETRTVPSTHPCGDAAADRKTIALFQRAPGSKLSSRTSPELFTSSVLK